MEQLTQLLQQINHWHWLCFSAFLFIIELLTFTTFFLWLGCAGLICAGCTYYLTIDYNNQVVLFGVLSTISLILTWKLKTKNRNFDIDINEKGHNLVGKEIALTDEILFGGKIRIDGTLWSYQSNQPLAIGTKIKIAGIDGNQLVIKQN